MLCIVQRRFPGPDRDFIIGEKVDTATWRVANVESLIRNRFILPLALSNRKHLLGEKANEVKTVETVSTGAIKVKKQKRVFAEADD